MDLLDKIIRGEPRTLWDPEIVLLACLALLVPVAHLRWVPDLWLVFAYLAVFVAVAARALLARALRERRMDPSQGSGGARVQCRGFSRYHVIGRPERFRLIWGVEITLICGLNLVGVNRETAFPAVLTVLFFWCAWWVTKITRLEFRNGYILLYGGLAWRRSVLRSVRLAGARIQSEAGGLVRVLEAGKPPLVIDSGALDRPRGFLEEIEQHCNRGAA